MHLYFIRKYGNRVHVGANLFTKNIYNILLTNHTVCNQHCYSNDYRYYNCFVNIIVKLYVYLQSVVKTTQIAVYRQ